MPSQPRILAIVGPTASGKTLLSMTLAEYFHGEIISADSRQIYRGMDIGTAKATLEEQQRIPHHLVNIKKPDEEYTVADFKHDATTAIHTILERGALPMLVGGTGLYLRAVLENLSIPEVKADPALRASIEADIAAHGLASVFEKLVSLDPEAAYIVDPKNSRRVIRALEVALKTGKPFTAQRKKQESMYHALMIGIKISPDILRRRIDQRIDDMMRNGLIEEVTRFVQRYRGTDGSMPAAFDAIGYREIIEYIEGAKTLDTAVAEMKLNTWHFAKRQMTWFKKDKNIIWIEYDAKRRNKVIHEAREQVATFLKN